MMNETLEEEAAERQEPMHLSDALPLMKSGDALLFSGAGIVSSVVRTIERRDSGNDSATHVGFVFKKKDLPRDDGFRRALLLPGDEDATFVFDEFGAFFGPRDAAGNMSVGAQFRAISDEIDLFVEKIPEEHRKNAVVGWAPLQQEIRERCDISGQVLSDALHKYYGMPYTVSLIDMISVVSETARAARAARSGIARALHCRSMREMCGIPSVPCCMLGLAKRQKAVAGRREISSLEYEGLVCSELLARMYLDLGVFAVAAELDEPGISDVRVDLSRDLRPREVIYGMDPRHVTPSDFLPVGHKRGAPIPLGTRKVKTSDRDGQVPWVFDGLVAIVPDKRPRFHSQWRAKIDLF